MKLLSSSKHATYCIIKVVLVSSRPARLTAAAQAASTLLHPLRWSQVYTPSLLWPSLLWPSLLWPSLLWPSLLYGHPYSGYTHSGSLHHGHHCFSQVYVPLVPRTHLSVAGAPFPYILGVPAHLLPALGRAAPSVGAGGEVWVWLDDGLVQGAPLQPLPSAYAYAYASASA